MGFQFRNLGRKRSPAAWGKTLHQVDAGAQDEPPPHDHGSTWKSGKQCDQIGQFIGLWGNFKAFGNNYFTQSAYIVSQLL